MTVNKAEIAKTILEDAGAEITFVQDGRQAVEAPPKAMYPEPSTPFYEYYDAGYERSFCKAFGNGKSERDDLPTGEEECTKPCMRGLT